MGVALIVLPPIFIISSVLDEGTSKMNRSILQVIDIINTGFFFEGQE